MRFGPTTGGFVGWLGVGVGLLASGWVLVDSRDVGSLRAVCLLLILVVLSWTYLLRPRVVLHPDELELRNALADWHLPLASVQGVRVRQTTVVYTEADQYVGIAVGHPLRKMMRRGPADELDPDQAITGLPSEQVAYLMTEQVMAQADTARALGKEQAAPRRTWALPEATALVVLAVAFLALMLG